MSNGDGDIVVGEVIGPTILCLGGTGVCAAVIPGISRARAAGRVVAAFGWRGA